MEENPLNTAWRYLKIYDGGTLVRSFKAARSRGVVGFWDEVESKFYAPASGEWLAPPTGNVVRTNNAVLDTGYKPTTKTSISCWLSGTCNGDAFVGFYSGDDSKDWRIFNYSGDLQLDIGGSGSIGDRLAVASWNPNVWNSVSAYNYGGYVQPMGGQLTSNSGTAHQTIDWDANGTILVGGYNASSGQNFAINGLRIFEDGELVKDYFPQVKDGVVGFEDRLDGTFIAPASGSWVLSSDTPIQVKSVTVQNGQYFDTGFKPNQDTRVVMSVDVQHSLEYWFGCWNATYNNGAYAMCNDNSNVYVGYDGQGGGQGSSPVANGTH